MKREYLIMSTLMLLALYAVVATSCSDMKKEVKTFATEFAQNVNAKKWMLSRRYILMQQRLTLLR